jgi:hypothetical protein
MNRLLVIGVMLAVGMSLLGGCGTSKEVSSSIGVNQVEEENQGTNTQVQNYDLRINGTKETLTVQTPVENEIPTHWNFFIGDEEKLKIPNENGIFHSEIKVQNLDQDDTDEILFYQYSTGSAGAILLNVYKPVDGALKLLFDSEKQAPPHGGDSQWFEIKYTGNYQVSFLDKANQVSGTIELNPEEYTEGADEFLPKIGTWIDPVNAYDIKDMDGDGITEIKTTQRVIGISHPDTLALLISTFSLVQNGYELREYQLVYEEDPSDVIVQFETSTRIKSD